MHWKHKRTRVARARVCASRAQQPTYKKIEMQLIFGVACFRSWYMANGRNNALHACLGACVCVCARAFVLLLLCIIQSQCQKMVRTLINWICVWMGLCVRSSHIFFFSVGKCFPFKRHPILNLNWKRVSSLNWKKKFRKKRI